MLGLWVVNAQELVVMVMVMMVIMTVVMMVAW